MKIILTERGYNLLKTLQNDFEYLPLESVNSGVVNGLMKYDLVKVTSKGVTLTKQGKEYQKKNKILPPKQGYKQGKN